MAFATTVINQSTPTNIPAQIRQLFIDAAWDGIIDIGALVSGTNCEYFVMRHISGAEILIQAPINTSTRSNPAFYSTAYPANHTFICLASATSTASMWTKLYTDSLIPPNLGFWTDVTSTPCLLFSEFYANQGNIDFDVHFRDNATDFDMLWITRNEGVVTGIKGAGVISTQLAPGVCGIVTWHGNNSTGVPEGAVDVAIDPLSGSRLGIGEYSTSFSTFRNPRSQVMSFTASMDDNSATKDRTQTVPLYVNGRILGPMNPDLIRFCRTTLTRNQGWTDPVDGRGFTTCGDGLMIGNLIADPIYVGV